MHKIKNYTIKNKILKLTIQYLIKQEQILYFFLKKVKKLLDTKIKQWYINRAAKMPRWRNW